MNAARAAVVQRLYAIIFFPIPLHSHSKISCMSVILILERALVSSPGVAAGPRPAVKAVAPTTGLAL